MSLLEVQAVGKAFSGVQAVRDVSFALGTGERLAVIGPNGAGKSTCFNLVGGQLRPDRGRVVLDGRDITGLPARAVWRLGVGRTFQVAATFGSMTVAENVQMALQSHHRRSLDLWRRAHRLDRRPALELLERVGLRDQAERTCGVLAYGDVKRLELAMALANAPRLLLMDEPTAGMAPAARRDLMALVTSIVRERGVAVLFTEHDMDVVFGHADRILVLDRGMVVTVDTPARVRADPRVQATYLGSRSHA